MKKILLATNNRGKIAELTALLKGLNLDLVLPEEIGLELEITEDGGTYAENAKKKATAFSKASGLVSLADDSGLEVDILAGAPGLRSARYAPQPAASDADRRSLLLRNLHGKPQPWKARFHASLVIAYLTGKIYMAEGTCEGEIIPEERGSGGFGYDSIFLVKGTGKTMAELSPDEKNHLSHRARAVQNTLTELIEFISS